MAHRHFDLVAQYTETTGTGTYTLTTAVANRRTFGAVLSNGDTTDYKVEGVDNAGNTAWEVGTGTYATSGTTLARTTIRSSSTGSAINWGAGVKTVTMVQAAYGLVTKGASGSSVDLGSATLSTSGAVTGGSYAFSGDTNTGIFSTGADTLALETGGSQRLVVDSSGHVIIAHTASLSGAFSAAARLQIIQDGNPSATFWRFNAANSGGPYIFFERSRSSTTGTNTLVQNGDGIGQIAFNGADGSAYQRAALFVVEVDGTAASGSMPGRIIFYTTPSGSTTPVERMRIDNAGAVRVPSVGTTASAGNAYLDNAASNNLLRSTSSMRYKTDAEPIDIEIVREIGPKLLDAMIWYRSLAPADRPGWSWYGMGAEMVAAIDPRLVHWTYPADAYEDVVTGTEEDDVPVLEEVEEVGQEIVLEEGRAVLRTVARPIHRQIVDLLPVVTEEGHPVTDEAGRPLHHPIPRVQKVSREVTERRLKDGAQMIPDGVQYERVALILSLYLADKIGAA
ncbi:hypothetical protein [Azospirillum himalayense]|uniref:Peptidase S74 domain-containing protein n=1 Tax=Azospirillum himalayense TaxID=654847 RepID=A0ABW0FYG4_9PROT